MHHERIKVRVSIIIIFTFSPFQSADYEISDWRHQNFHRHLEQIICQREREKKTPRENAKRGSDYYEHNRIHQLTDKRTPKGT